MWDYHMHTMWCGHAEGTMEEYVISAINKGLEEIGFSAHTPREYFPKGPHIPAEEYGMPEAKLEEYFKTADMLAEKYSDKIIVKKGMELDYLPVGMDKMRSFIEKIRDKADYIIGSVHIIETPNAGLWPIDDIRHVQFDKEDIREVYRIYAENVKKAVESGLFDILGHADLVKRLNRRHPDFDKFIEVYREIMEIVKKKGMTVEINTSGFRHPVGEQYPAVGILKMAAELDIPIVFDSDSHHPSQIAFEFERALRIAKDAGIKHVARFGKRKVTIIPIENIKPPKNVKSG